MGRMAQTLEEQKHYDAIHAKVNSVIANPKIALLLHDGQSITGRIKSINVQPQDRRGDLIFEGLHGAVAVDYLDIADLS